MGYPKCRCGSNDKLVFINKVRCRKSDEKPHICLDDIDKVPQYKQTIKDLQKEIANIREANTGLQAQIDYMKSTMRVVN